jgi:hypothetical protein
VRQPSCAPSMAPVWLPRQPSSIPRGPLYGSPLAPHLNPTDSPPPSPLPPHCLPALPPFFRLSPHLLRFPLAPRFLPAFHRWLPRCVRRAPRHSHNRLPASPSSPTTPGRTPQPLPSSPGRSLRRSQVHACAGKSFKYKVQVYPYAGISCLIPPLLPIGTRESPTVLPS